MNRKGRIFNTQLFTHDDSLLTFSQKNTASHTHTHTHTHTHKHKTSTDIWYVFKGRVSNYQI